MRGWTEDHELFRSALRRFVNSEVLPRRQALEHEGLPPYDVLRTYYNAFGVGDAALERFERTQRGEEHEVSERSAAESLLPTIEFSRCSPGLVTALGASIHLTAGTILRSGNAAQRERWAPGLLTLETVGAWAITEPDSGSDAFGSMRTTARATDDGYVLNGTKTFITNGPYADVVVVICKLDLGEAAAERGIATFVVERGAPGLSQSSPLRKMGLHSSPTGEVVLDDVYVPADHRLMGRAGTGDQRANAGRDAARDGARAAFVSERTGVAAMALGVIDRCVELCTEYARERRQFGRRIGDFQLVQLKLAEMEIARLNVESMLLRCIDTVDRGGRPTLADASAMKLYAARAAMAVTVDAVQVFGGAGYMAEHHVEQLCRDAKVLQIYGGTDEIQVAHIAKELLGPSDVRRDRGAP